jgi:hypothetical protein
VALTLNGQNPAIAPGRSVKERRSVSTRFQPAYILMVPMEILLLKRMEIDVAVVACKQCQPVDEVQPCQSGVVGCRTVGKEARVLPFASSHRKKLRTAIFFCNDPPRISTYERNQTIIHLQDVCRTASQPES